MPMRISSPSRSRIAAGLPALCALLALCALPARADTINVTLEQPRTVAPHFTTDASGQGICEQNLVATATCVYGVESFKSFTSAQAANGFTSTFTTGQNNFPAGDSIRGAYSGQLTRSLTNQYGGAQGATAYPVAMGTSVYRMDLTTAGVPGVNYLGVWITAMDASNVLKIHTSSGYEFDLTSSVLKAFINKTATPSAYYGNPTASYLGQDSAEPFAYVNFFNTDGLFTYVEFTNSSGSGFESSNHAAGYFNPLYVTGQTVLAVVVSEPSAVAVLGAALAGMSFLIWLRKGRAPQPSPGRSASAAHRAWRLGRFRRR